MFSFVEPDEDNMLVYGEEVKRACDEIAMQSHGEHTGEFLIDLLLQGKVIGWLVFNDIGDFMGFTCGNVQQYNSGKTFCFNGGWGQTEGRWEEFDRFYAETAKAYDCIAYEIKGRRGFLRALKQYGIKEKYSTLRREL